MYLFNIYFISGSVFHATIIQKWFPFPKSKLSLHHNDNDEGSILQLTNTPQNIIGLDYPNTVKERIRPELRENEPVFILTHTNKESAHCSSANLFFKTRLIGGNTFVIISNATVTNRIKKNPLAMESYFLK